MQKRDFLHFLSVAHVFSRAGQNFRPPIGHSNSAPKLGSITERDEDELVMPVADAADSDADAEDDESRLDESGPGDDCDGDVFLSCSDVARYSSGATAVVSSVIFETSSL